MKNLFARGFFCCLLPLLPALSQTEVPDVPFELHERYRIVVTGSMPGVESFRMMIDTGTCGCVVSRRLVKKLGLAPLPETVKYNAFGRVGTASQIILRGVRLGPVLTTLPCIIEDIPFPKVDAMMGLILLRRQPLTIDYEARKINFGPLGPMETLVNFDPRARFITLPVLLDNETINLVLDTGASGVVLFRSRLKFWMQINSARSGLSLTHLGAHADTRQLTVRKIGIGNCAWKNSEVLVVDDESNPGFDGVLGPAALGVKRLHIDFQRGILGFDRHHSRTAPPPW